MGKKLTDEVFNKNVHVRVILLADNSVEISDDRDVGYGIQRVIIERDFLPILIKWLREIKKEI